MTTVHLAQRHGTVVRVRAGSSSGAVFDERS
jgi:hypothetical protein